MKVITSQIYDFNFGKWYYLSAPLNISQAAIEEELKGELNRMRERVFDRFLLKHHLYSVSLVKNLPAGKNVSQQCGVYR
ncbi:MAG: hypothetical protein LW832_00135 [Parachlamydia sp.]|jgi:hypothetical protein|nr:hypothetical protein [Parachlamydia sp.]